MGMEITPGQSLTCVVMSCPVLEAGTDLALSLLDSGIAIKPCSGEIPPVDPHEGGARCDEKDFSHLHLRQ